MKALKFRLTDKLKGGEIPMTNEKVSLYFYHKQLDIYQQANTILNDEENTLILSYRDLWKP